MNAADEKELLEELANCLEEQIALARRGNLAAMLQMAVRCEPLVAQIARTGLLEKPEYKTNRNHLAKLYRDLQLLLSAQQGAVAEQIKSVHKGKKTLAAYRGNM
jgi:hypothetical protein